jgi:hypothetical protein
MENIHYKSNKNGKNSLKFLLKKIAGLVGDSYQKLEPVSPKTAFAAPLYPRGYIVPVLSQKIHKNRLFQKMISRVPVSRF